MSSIAFARAFVSASTERLWINAFEELPNPDLMHTHSEMDNGPEFITHASLSQCIGDESGAQ